MAKVTSESGHGVAAKAAIAGGLVANTVNACSLHMLKTTEVWSAPWTGWLHGALELLVTWLLLGFHFGRFRVAVLAERLHSRTPFERPVFQGSSIVLVERANGVKRGFLVPFRVHHSSFGGSW
ncbi:hypothetical protein V6N11_040279 [Hibiscus sabdariffa]|uniref:Uncharacterized protein n=1 Tax=Hibiscus sabdariffa TaxID=183260 RepID=A0ABR2RH27_9ROSI